MLILQVFCIHICSYDQFLWILCYVVQYLKLPVVHVIPSFCSQMVKWQLLVLTTEVRLAVVIQLMLCVLRQSQKYHQSQ